MIDDWEEDPIPPWQLKQQQDALEAIKTYRSEKKTVYTEGQQVGNFIFIKYKGTSKNTT